MRRLRQRTEAATKLSSDAKVIAALRAELKQCMTELEEAARLLGPRLPACASLFSAAAARVNAALAPFDP